MVKIRLQREGKKKAQILEAQEMVKLLNKLEHMIQ